MILIQYENEEYARLCKKHLNNKPFMGNSLHIFISKFNKVYVEKGTDK